MRFYDVKDEEDLTRVEMLLHRGGIEYSLTQPPANANIFQQIEVAEEDVSLAEELLLEEALKR